jgi:hypothetical protein
MADDTVIDTVRTIDDLRSILADEIGKIRKGETTAANVNAVTNASGKILSTVKLEMEYAKLVGKTPHIAFIEKIDKQAQIPAPK